MSIRSCILTPAAISLLVRTRHTDILSLLYRNNTIIHLKLLKWKVERCLSARPSGLGLKPTEALI